LSILADGETDLFEGKNALHISASAPETAILLKAGVKSVKTIDVRPECNPDIVADICNMPSVETAAYDLVLANCVLNHVYDDYAALSEIERVLVNSGIFVTWVFDSGQSSTIEYDDASGWYGAENLEKYRVGTYRKYGTEEFPGLLHRKFKSVAAYEIWDAPSESLCTWYVCRK
jgi:SAM-dependent methyltransferase